MWMTWWSWWSTRCWWWCAAHDDYDEDSNDYNDVVTGNIVSNSRRSANWCSRFSNVVTSCECWVSDLVCLYVGWLMVKECWFSTSVTLENYDIFCVLSRCQCWCLSLSMSLCCYSSFLNVARRCCHEATMECFCCFSRMVEYSLPITTANMSYVQL